MKELLNKTSIQFNTTHFEVNNEGMLILLHVQTQVTAHHKHMFAWMA